MKDAELLTGLRAGEPGAFREAVKRYSPQMLATANRIVGAAEAEDLVQEAWLSAFRQIAGFEGRSQLGTWLCRIVSNGAISALRRRKPEQSISADDGRDPSADWFDETGHWRAHPGLWNPGRPDQLLDAADLQRCLDRHIDKLPDSQRQVLLLRDTHEKSFDEICNAMDLSASNVRVLLHRGRLKLMAMVNHFQETGTC